MKDVKSCYDKWSINYDSDQNKTRDLDVKVIKHFLPQNKIKSKIIVEPACGTGKNTLYFSQFSKQVNSFDFSSGMLEKAKEKLKNKTNVNFSSQNILKTWPIDDNSSDFVVICLVLEHIENIKFIFTESYRVLKTGGILLISELHPDKQKKGSKARFEDKDGNIKKISNFFHPTEEYLKLSKESGFKKED